MTDFISKEWNGIPNHSDQSGYHFLEQIAEPNYIAPCRWDHKNQLWVIWNDEGPNPIMPAQQVGAEFFYRGVCMAPMPDEDVKLLLDTFVKGLQMPGRPPQSADVLDKPTPGS